MCTFSEKSDAAESLNKVATLTCVSVCDGSNEQFKQTIVFMFLSTVSQIEANCDQCSEILWKRFKKKDHTFWISGASPIIISVGDMVSITPSLSIICTNTQFRLDSLCSHGEVLKSALMGEMNP